MLTSVVMFCVVTLLGPTSCSTRNELLTYHGCLLHGISLFCSQTLLSSIQGFIYLIVSQEATFASKLPCLSFVSGCAQVRIGAQGTFMSEGPTICGNAKHDLFGRDTTPQEFSYHPVLDTVFFSFRHARQIK